MALWHENECVGCPKEMGCLGDGCPNRNVPHYSCDECGEEFEREDLWDVDGKMMCRDCLREYAEQYWDKVKEED